MIVAICGCQSTGSNQIGREGRVSKSRALEIAKQTFSELYPDRLSSYKVSISTYLYKDAWYVLFTGTGEYAAPGGYTPILIDKRNGKIQVFPSD